MRKTAIEMAGQLGYAVGMCIAVPYFFFKGSFKMASLIIRAGWLHVKAYHAIRRVHAAIPDWWVSQRIEEQRLAEDKIRINAAAELFGKN